MPIHMNNMEIFTSLVNILIGIDEVCSLAGFQVFGIDEVAVKFNSLHEVLMSLSKSDEELTLVSVCGLFGGVKDAEVCIVFDA